MLSRAYVGRRPLITLLTCDGEGYIHLQFFVVKLHPSFPGAGKNPMITYLSTCVKLLVVCLIPDITHVPIYFI
jgi:hypothetical protein